VIEPSGDTGNTASLWRRIMAADRQDIWQSATSRMLGAAALAGLVFALTGNAIAAAAVAAGELILAPAMRQGVQAVWPAGET
jgi:hypothetical protein